MGKTYKQIICIFVVVLTFPLSSCNENSPTAYSSIERVGGDNFTTFVADKGSPHFSFEYPTYYELRSYQSMPGYPSTSVRLIGTSIEQARGGYIKHISLYINSFSKDVDTDLRERIADYKSGVRSGLTKDFKLNEKRRVTVAGIEGWEIIVSQTVLPVVLHGFDDAGLPVNEPTATMSRDIFFDYQNMIWRISLYSDLTTYEQAKADFEHLLRTFKVSE